MRFGQNVLRMTWTRAFCTVFMRKRTVFPFWREFQARCDNFEKLWRSKMRLWPKRAAHDLKTAFCTIFMESALCCLFGENLRQVWRSWQLWRSEIRKGQNVPRMTWKEGFVQFLWKAHRFPTLERMLGQCDDFDNFHAQKSYLAKTCCAWHEKERFVQFSWKAHCFPVFEENFRPVWRFWELSTLKNAIWSKRAAHDLKRAFCTIFIKSARFSLFGENFRPVWRFWELWRPKMRFGQNVLPHDLKRAFCTIFIKSALFSLFGENFKPVWRFWELLTPQKCDLAKTCCAWPEKSVLYSFHRKRTVFLFWREFQASVTILKTLTLKNAIWPKRAAHDLKRTFLQFLRKAHSFYLLKRIWDKCDDFENFDAH